MAAVTEVRWLLCGKAAVLHEIWIIEIADKDMLYCVL